MWRDFFIQLQSQLLCGVEFCLGQHHNILSCVEEIYLCSPDFPNASFLFPAMSVQSLSLAVRSIKNGVKYLGMGVLALSVILWLQVTDPHQCHKLVVTNNVWMCSWVSKTCPQVSKRWTNWCISVVWFQYSFASSCFFFLCLETVLALDVFRKGLMFVSCSKVRKPFSSLLAIFIVVQKGLVLRCTSWLLHPQNARFFHNSFLTLLRCSDECTLKFKKQWITRLIYAVNVWKTDHWCPLPLQDKSIRLWRMNKGGRVVCVAQGLGHAHGVGAVSCSR